METREVICGICPGKCHVQVEIEEGRIVKVSPSKVNKPAALCMRGTAPDAVINSEDRVKYPLRRVGDKGTLEFERISWDEAISEIGEKFRGIIEKYGAQSLVSHFGRGGFDQATDDFVDIAAPKPEHPGFFDPIGSPNNATVGSLCYVSFGVFAPLTNFGFMGPWLVPDYANASKIVIWGANPRTGSPPFAYQQIREAQKRGAKIYCVDHYKSMAAEMADEYIPIKSGTDGAFILAMINYMFENDMMNQGFLDKYTHGWELLKDYVKDFTLERASKETGIPEDRIRWFIEELAGEEALALNTYTGLEYSDQGAQSIRALYMLWAFTGNLDVKGGLLINPGKPGKRVKERVGRNIHSRRIGSREFPLFDKILNQPQFTEFPKAVLENDPYPVRGLLNIGSVISQVYPNSDLYEQALMGLDYYVQVDRFLTKDALYADIVLPATTHYEEQSYVVYPGKAEIRERVVDPVGESKPNIQIMHMIAEELGFGYNFPKDEEELLDFAFYHQPEALEALKKDGIYIYPENKKEKIYKQWETGDLREDGKEGFPTPTGKMEAYSTLLQSYGYDPLPVYKGGKESEEGSPELFEKYPLVLNTGARINSTFRTQHLNIPELTKYQENAEILINPVDAEPRGIKDGDKVYVFNDRGKIPMTANVTEKAQPGDLEANMGGGGPLQVEGWRDANINDLTDDLHQDPISGFPVFKRLLCQVEKINE